MNLPNSPLGFIAALICLGVAFTTAMIGAHLTLKLFDKLKWEGEWTVIPYFFLSMFSLAIGWFISFYIAALIVN